MPRKIIVSYSELDTFRQCPLKHLWSYKQRWQKPAREGGALDRGTQWHRIMEEHHGVLRKHQQNPTGHRSPANDREVLREARRAVEPLLVDTRNGEQTETQELLEWMYDGYVEQYGLDDEYITIGLEVPFAVPLPWPDGRPSHYIFKGKIDRIMKSRYDGGLWIEDHKTCKDLPTEFELQIDDQFGGYTWAVQQLGYKVRGAIHSAARTTRNTGDYPDHMPRYKPQTLEQRFSRTYLNRTDRELVAIANDLFATARNAYPPAGQALPLYSAPDVRQCGWKCDFKEIHLGAREGMDPVSLLKADGFAQDFTRH